MQYIKQIKKYPSICFLIISLIPLFWFFKKLPFAYGDSGLHSIYNFYTQLNKMYQYTWNDMFGTGINGEIYVILLPLYVVKSALELLKVSYWFNQFLSIYFSFILSLLFFYLYILDIFHQSSHKVHIAFFSSIFYIFNPISMFLYIGPLMLNLYILPYTSILLFITNRYMMSRKIHYLILLVPLNIIFSIVFVNPSFVLPVIGLVLIVTLFLRQIKFYRVPFLFLLKFLFLFVILNLLPNIFWILPFVLSMHSSYSQASLILNPIDTLVQTSDNYTSIYSYFRILPYKFSEYLWIYKQSDWFMWYFKSTLYILVGQGLFTFILVFSFLASKSNLFFQKIILGCLTLLLVSIFLLKGSHDPFGVIFIYFITYIPYFGIFRSPINKFGILFIFSLSILFGVSVTYFYSKYSDSKLKKFAKIILFLLFLSFGIYLYPLISGRIITDPVKARGNIITSEIKVPYYYQDAANFFNRDKNTFRVLALPLRPSMNIGFKWENGYDGGDPTHILINHQTISTLNLSRTNSAIILKSASDLGIENLINMSGIFNIKYIINQKDVDPIFGGYGGVILKEPLVISKELSELGGIRKVSSFGDIEVYKLNKFFLPHLYTPESIMISDKEINFLQNIVSQPDYTIRSAIYFKNQIKEKLNKFFSDGLVRLDGLLPIVEFKKINPTKYSIRVHKAKGVFPLVFSETFHDGWKAYLVKPSKFQSNLNSQISKYKILEGNQEDQATTDELQNYVTDGWVSSLGDGKGKRLSSIDFVSKNFQGTIQNDNLPNRPIWETWLPQVKNQKSKIKNILSLNRNVIQLPDESHLMVNGYANSWIIDPKEVCKAEGFCRKNEDGSFDMELVLEFWPQRLFYIGLVISGMALLCGLGYLGIDFFHRKRMNVLKYDK